MRESEKDYVLTRDVTTVDYFIFFQFRFSLGLVYKIFSLKYDNGFQIGLTKHIKRVFYQM